MERFEEKFTPVTESGCWLWTGAINHKGYGLFLHNNKTRPAHRVSYELYKGEIPDGLFVCHTCDMPSCVNPNHLFAGTAKENTGDMMSKGRLVIGKRYAGKEHHNSKLTDDQVIEIRKSGKSNQALAIEFKVSKTLIGNIKRREAWQHLQ